jgi:hypothetical protein
MFHWSTTVQSITGKEPITVVTTGGPTAATPRIDLNYATVTSNDNIVTAAPNGNALTLTDDDWFIAADYSDSLDVKKFTIQRLRSFINSTQLTGVEGRYGLTGSGTSGYVNIDVEYTGTGNIILAANTPGTLIDANSTMIVSTDSGANASVNQIAISDVPLNLFNYSGLPGGSVFTGMTGCGGTLVGGTTGLVPLPGLTVTDVNSTNPVAVGSPKTLTIPNANAGILAGMDIRGTNTPYYLYGRIISVTSTTEFQCTVYNTGPIPANEPLTFIVDDCNKVLRSDATWVDTVQAVTATGAGNGAGGILIGGSAVQTQRLA